MKINKDIYNTFKFPDILIVITVCGLEWFGDVVRLYDTGDVVRLYDTEDVVRLYDTRDVVR
jgi:hypothetical protein